MEVVLLGNVLGLGKGSAVDTYDVVIVGSGFGALAAAKSLGKAGVTFSLISSTTEHLFQPLLYQAATGMLSTGEIAPPIRRILAQYDSADVRLGRVVDVDPEAHQVTYIGAGQRHTIGFGRLIVATGATQAYFGRDEFKDRTFALKTVDDAIALREQILSCYETAHMTTEPAARKELLSFVVVGAGATGVELAGQIRDLAHRYFAGSFPDIEPDDVTVTLVDGVKEVLPAFGGKLSAYARTKLEKSGVDVVTGAMVTDIADDVVTVQDVDTKTSRTYPAKTVIWSAGVQASDLAATVAERTGCETDRAGRLLVHDDLTVGSAKDVYAIGDVTSLNKLPGTVARGDAAGQARCQDDHRQGRRRDAVRVHRQGQHVDRRSIQRCGTAVRQGRHVGAHRLAHVARGAPDVLGRLPKPLRRGGVVDDLVHRRQAAALPVHRQVGVHGRAQRAEYGRREANSSLGGEAP